MIDRDKLWTGDLNRRALDPQPGATVVRVQLPLGRAGEKP